MKAFFILIISLSFSLMAFGQADSLGFTNKAEAKNLMVNGLKEGKWVEYIDWTYRNTKDTISSLFYRLIIYRSGKPYGIVRDYCQDGILKQSIPYSNGKKNGVVKWYYFGGKLCSEIPYDNGKKNGIEKTYYEDGQLQSETLYFNGRKSKSTTHYSDLIATP